MTDVIWKGLSKRRQSGLSRIGAGGSETVLSTFDFNLPLVNADGVILERDNMYYNIFLDGELWPLTPEDFNIPEELVNVPYLY